MKAISAFVLALIGISFGNEPFCGDAISVENITETTITLENETIGQMPG